MVAGTPSHGKGAHEFNAGTILLTDCLKKMKVKDADMERICGGNARELLKLEAQS